MYIAAKLLALCDSPDCRNNTISYYKRTNVPAFAFRNEFLYENVLSRALQCFDDRLGDFDTFRENDSHTLSSFQQFDDDWHSTYPFNGWQDIPFLPDKCCFWNPDLVLAEDLQVSQLVP